MEAEAQVKDMTSTQHKDAKIDEAEPSNPSDQIVSKVDEATPITKETTTASEKPTTTPVSTMAVKNL